MTIIDERSTRPSPLQMSSTPASLFVDNPTEREVDVVLVTTRVGDVCAYTVLVDGHRPVVVARHHPLPMSEMAFEAFAEHVATLDPSRRWRFAFSAPEKFLTAYLEFQHAWKHLDRIDAPSSHPVMEVAFRESRRAAAALGGSACEPDPDPEPALAEWVTVATDGSSGFRGAKHRGGYGWVSEEGRHGSGTIASGTPVDAEVCAIIDAVQSHPKPRKIRVITDSRDAQRIAVAAIRGEVMSPNPSLSPRMYQRIEKALKGRVVRIDWVKGHNGHPLNEGADRLSRHARRARHMDVAAEVSEAIRTSIVDEAVEGWRALRDGQD